MQYNLMQQLKTKQKQIKAFSSIEDVKNYIKDNNLTFVDKFYLGNIPIFNGDSKVYFVQGQHQGFTCSLTDEDMQQLTNQNA